MEAWLLHWISQYGYIGIFSLLMLGIIGLPVPDETLLAFSGYLVFKGQLSAVPTIVAASLGSICGISFSYWLGRRGGYYFIHRHGDKVGITPERIERAGRWLDRPGRWGLVVGYFIPGVRHLTALAAGTAQLKYSVFAAFAYAGAMLWSVTFIAAGFFLEKEWLGTSAVIRRIALITLASIAFILLLRYLDSRKSPTKI